MEAELFLVLDKFDDEFVLQDGQHFGLVGEMQNLLVAAVGDKLQSKLSSLALVMVDL